MLDAAPTVDIYAPNARPFEVRHVERFTPGDPAQVLYRRMLSELDEDEFLTIETDLEYYLAGGEMSAHISSLLNAARAA